MEQVRESEWLRELGEKTISEHPELGWIRAADVRIGYLVSDREKKSSGRTVFGECRKIPPREKAYNPNDFTVTFYEASTAPLDERQLGILMLHELMHIGTTDKGDLRIVPHDVEDFSAIIDAYGYDWSRT